VYFGSFLIYLNSEKLRSFLLFIKVILRHGLIFVS